MWTKELRRIYRREGDGYPSDLRDVEWARLAPLIPPALPWGATAQDRHAGSDERNTLCAAHRLAGGAVCCATAFPLHSTVYNIFRKFQRYGTWEAIWAELHMALRERMGREASPAAAVLDSQSVKSAEKGGGRDSQVGYDAGKQVKGRKSTP